MSISTTLPSGCRRYMVSGTVCIVSNGPVDSALIPVGSTPGAARSRSTRLSTSQGSTSPSSSDSKMSFQIGFIRIPPRNQY